MFITTNKYSYSQNEIIILHGNPFTFTQLSVRVSCIPTPVVETPDSGFQIIGRRASGRHTIRYWETDAECRDAYRRHKIRKT